MKNMLAILWFFVWCYIVHHIFFTSIAHSLAPSLSVHAIGKNVFPLFFINFFMATKQKKNRILFLSISLIMDAHKAKNHWQEGKRKN